MREETEEVLQEFRHWLEKKRRNLPPTVMAEAEAIIYGDREEIYGDPSKNLARIAELWTQYLQKNVRQLMFNFNSCPYAGLEKYKLTDDMAREITQMMSINITVTDVCRMMQGLKWARDEHQHKRDNIVDDIGYAALVQRCRDARHKSMEVPAGEAMATEVRKDVEIFKVEPKDSPLFPNKRKPDPRKRKSKRTMKRKS